MNYRDFSVKINGENNSEITIFIFTVFKKLSFYEFSAKSLAQKVLNVVFLPEISARPLTSRDRTADVTYCTDVTFFQRPTSGRLLHFVPFLTANSLRSNC